MTLTPANTQTNTQTHTGKVVLITGASSGIGYASALEFIRRGAQVGATARNADRLIELQAAARGLPGAVSPIVADVRNADDMTRAVAETVAAYGRLDILIANAGLGQRGALVEAAWPDIDDVLRTNIDGVLHSVRAAVPELRRAGGGHIVMISSVVGSITTPFATTYAASKAAVNAFGRGLRTELRADHIWVTNMLIGQTHTEFARNRRGTSGQIANIPGMTPEKVALGVVRATERRNRWMTLRPFDTMLVALGMFAPAIMDRIVARSYKS